MITTYYCNDCGKVLDSTVQPHPTRSNEVEVTIDLCIACKAQVVEEASEDVNFVCEKCGVEK
jgi:predicted RNA-binding Zn-ribbon protein involved in translation (DUF1610 family)